MAVVSQDRYHCTSPLFDAYLCEVLFILFLFALFLPFLLRGPLNLSYEGIDILFLILPALLLLLPL